MVVCEHAISMGLKSNPKKIINSLSGEILTKEEAILIDLVSNME